MQKTDLEFIKKLSFQDPKNLLAKLAKVNEEAGELSGKILAYEASSGSKHRFVDKEGILEEVADIFLAAQSIAYVLGFEHKEIEEEVMRKASKWANIQQREARMKNEVPFEIHVTIEEANKDNFVQTCKSLEVKPIILSLQAKDKEIKDVMTSSVIIGTNKDAYEEMKRISDGLSSNGFKVVREKIETVPWHSAAPSREFNPINMPKDCYFESHLGIHIDNTADVERLKTTLKKMDFYIHLSKNFFKENSDGSHVIMGTYRNYNTFSEDFQEDVLNIENELLNSGFKVDKVVTEFSIYDTKISHDLEWLKS